MIVTDARLGLDLNAFMPIDVTDAGITIDVIGHPV
jgi:hypothetical protein